MADMLALLKGEQLVEISEDFDYLRATEDFVGLKLFPLAKTENMKLAIYNLVDGADVPVMAFVHALDTEARIGDRPDAQELKFELFLIKEKLNQGEAIRKKIKDLGMGNSERAVLEAIYNDASNLISRVLTRMEVMACELLSTGRITVKENNVDKTVDFGLKAEHYITVADWANASHDIIGDLVKVKNRSKGKIVRALVSSDVMQKMLANEQFAKAAGSQSPLSRSRATFPLCSVSSLSLLTALTKRAQETPKSTTSSRTARFVSLKLPTHLATLLLPRLPKRITALQVTLTVLCLLLSTPLMTLRAFGLRLLPLRSPVRRMSIRCGFARFCNNGRQNI